MSRKAGTSDDANDLLHIHTYFKSPVNTLVASLQQTSEYITVHDLLDAYSTICLRVSTVEHALLPPNDAPALQYVRSNSLSLGRCMQRDIRLALLDPLRVAKTESLASVSWPATGISEEQFCAARITAMLCHSALNLVSAIFRSAAMHRLFSHNVLQHLLDDVLVVAQSSELPTVDDVKTRSLAWWVLSTLQLPEEVVRASRSPIMEILNDAAEDMGSHLRACDIIHNIISTYPRIFLMDSAQFLPDILKRLNATTATVRMDATVALAGFALGVLSTSSMMAESELPKIQAAVHKFIRSQMPSSHAAPISSTSTSTLLPDYIANAAKGDLTDHSAYGPRWAIVVVCCLIVLSGKAIFTGQRALRLVLTTMERVAKRRDATGLNLVACAWKCLIWVFLQLPPNRPPESTGPDRRSPTTKDVAFGIIKQDLRGGTGACLIAGLLYSADNPDSSIGEMCRGSHLDWAVDVLREMVTYPSVTVYRDSLVVLERLLSGIGTSPEDSEALPQGSRWNPNHLVVKTLFARHVLRAAHQDFLEALHAANQFEPAWVRPLGETEILKRWEDLADIWTSSVRRQLQMLHTTFSLPEALIHAWQALLLVQTQLTQEKEHLTTSPDLTSRTVSIISDFLAWIPGPVVPFNAALSADEAQYRVLTLCHQLWMVMRNVFSDYWLLTVAESILASVLRRTFDLSDERVRNAWSQFCAALVSVSAPKLIATLVVEDEQSRVIDVKRELWRMMANGWPSRIPKPTPEDAVEFLAIPMRCWYMEQREIDAWISIFDDVLSHSSYSSSPASPIFDTIADNINGATLEKFVNIPAIVLHMLDHLRLSDDSGHPLKFLRCIDDLLCILYSDVPENVSLALQILGPVRRIVSECPTRALVTVLATLSKGVATWVGDERERLLNAEYNEVVIPIYRDALHALKTVSVTPDDLTSLASLLYSAFIRMPDPGHGPVAFYEFWMHIYPSLQGMRGAYPEQIKVALQACNDVYGGLSSQDLSVDTDSASGSHGEHTPRAQTTPIKSESLTPRSAASIRSRLHELQRGPLTAPRSRQNLSPIISPEIPHLPASLLDDESSAALPTSRRKGKRARATDAASSRATSSRRATSDWMPSSPTDAIRSRRIAPAGVSRVAHEKAANAMDRPLKRRKVDPPAPAPASITRSDARVTDVQPATTPTHTRRRKPSTESAPDVLVDSCMASPPAARPPRTATSKGKQALRDPSAAPALPRPAATPTSDDYAAWEAPICEDDDAQPEDDRDAVVPSSQPSDAEHSDDSFLPSFMKTAARDDPLTDPAVVPDDDALGGDDDSDLLDLPLTACPRPRSRSRHHRTAPSPPRTHTAPASLARSPPSPPSPSSPFTHLPHPTRASPPRVPSPPRPSSPRRRARTASAPLEELRSVYDALRADGSQLPVGEIAAASALTSRLGAMLSEKLSRRLRGASAERGRERETSGSDGKGKGKERGGAEASG